MEYLIGDGEVKCLTPSGEIAPATQKEIGSLSKKQIAIRSDGLIVLDEKGEVVWSTRKRYAQHFFPLSVVDYARAIYAFERFGKPLPILSVDSHDTLECDFKCADCLSGCGKSLPIEEYPKDNFKMPLEFYEHILKEIVEYSSRRGFSKVRFEQSGEGNPDFYEFRPEILSFAKRNANMGIVYVTSGSQTDDSLRHSLIENADFIRISFPGIGQNAYRFYSGQTDFTYNDSMKNLEKILDERRKNGREKDLMVGARLALRSEHEGAYLDFAKRLREMGLDVIQIVKILVPEYKRPEDFPVTSLAMEQLQATRDLENPSFGVSLPHSLDSMYYSREIEDRREFPQQCFSALIQPVLMGRSLFVCTKSEVMYSQAFRLGTFQGVPQELEQFLSPAQVKEVTKNVPGECKSCCSIYDNMLMHSLQGVIRSIKSGLRFYEVIK
ncbi:MAG: hypothetical protein MUF61_01135 [archaeon]|jgi:wyosine [tRNA(Phe)-imidazoG37] synthetase (radical SAM superfamily)|nr:hypothetical protein [archaeon]